MKILQISIVLGLLLCLSSCSKDKIEPYNPTEWRFDKYSDSSILPGDDFYRFACGKGIASEGSDSWAPFSRWGKQQSDYEVLALSDEADNPVPVFKRINELRTEAPNHVAEAFASMRERLDGIESRTGNKGFPEKAAEYYRNGYILFHVNPMILYGHKFGIGTTAVYNGTLLDWTGQQLETAGIKEKYDKLLPKAQMFQKYLLDNIKVGEESIDDLDAGDSEECRQLKACVESFAKTKAGDSAIERFAVALGNRNPDFVPADDATRQYFELVDKMEDAEMKEAADAFLWCSAVSWDMDFILNADTPNIFLTLLYPNLYMNMSHCFCEKYVKPECAQWSKEIFEALRGTMAERIDQSEWMSPYTKASAREKIDAMECHTGILDWSKYEADMPVSGDFCSALHEIGRSYVSKLMANSGENTSLDHIIASLYIMTTGGSRAYTANAFYIQTVNAMCILPSTSILMDMNPEFPFLTYIIGHEMCHGFDANGANFNARGELGDWWAIDDRLVFKKKQEQLIGIYNQYYVDGLTFCNGAKTITEDMADLGGMEIAWITTSRELEEKYGGEELQEKKRRFFKSYAIMYAEYTSIEEKLKLVEEDEHSLKEYRINGIVNNIDDWYQLFDVTPDSKYYLAPERRVYLW